MSKFTPYFDPDEVVMTKPILKKILTAIIERWKKDPKKHRFQIAMLVAFRASLRFQTDASIELIFKEVIKVVNRMQRYNAMLKLRKEMPSTNDLANLAIREIERGIID